MGRRSRRIASGYVREAARRGPRAGREEGRAAGRELGLKGRALFMPVRAGVSGATTGPELADIFAIQGQEISLRVIDQLLAELEREAGAGAGAQG